MRVRNSLSTQGICLLIICWHSQPYLLSMQADIVTIVPHTADTFAVSDSGERNSIDDSLTQIADECANSIAERISAEVKVLVDTGAPMSAEAIKDEVATRASQVRKSAAGRACGSAIACA